MRKDREPKSLVENLINLEGNTTDNKYRSRLKQSEVADFLAYNFNRNIEITDAPQQLGKIADALNTNVYIHIDENTPPIWSPNGFTDEAIYHVDQTQKLSLEALNRGASESNLACYLSVPIPESETNVKAVYCKIQTDGFFCITIMTGFEQTPIDLNRSDYYEIVDIPFKLLMPNTKPKNLISRMQYFQKRREQKVNAMLAECRTLFVEKLANVIPPEVRKIIIDHSLEKTKRG